jgi:hypothetical protein
MPETVADVVRRTPATQYADTSVMLRDKAQAWQITDAASYAIAVELGLGVKELLDAAEAHHRPVIDAAHKTHKAACDALKRITDPLTDAKRFLASKVTVWDLAERERVQREERLAIEQAAREQEQAALDAIDTGADEAEVDAIVSAPVVAPVTMPVRAAGVSKPRDNWTAQITDLMELVKAVAAGKVPITALQANTVFLGQQARSLKSLLNYPGVRVVNNPTTAFLGRRQ